MTTLFIQPDRIITPGRALENHAVVVSDGLIAELAPTHEVACPPGATRVEAEGLTLAPGFIDLQLNGAFGHDFTTDPASIWEVARLLPMYGVTSFLPTIITSPAETMAQAQEAWLQGPPPGFLGAAPLGLHLEGPFLNPARLGAHNSVYLRPPDLSAIESWSPEQGVRLVTLAPELPGSEALIAALRERGVVISTGHSMATFEQASRAFDLGVSYATHLFNAMPPLDHREPGLAGAILAHPGVTASLIADGIHIHPAMLSIAWRLKGPHKLNLVTDAMAALGMPPGRYLLGDREVISDGTSARHDDGRLAGSLLSLDRAVRNLIAFTGCSPQEAIMTVTEVPTSVLGIERQRGRIAPGHIADLVLLTPDLQVVSTILGGELIKVIGSR
ncbi:MAG: N-acetylglucosamine-6-phosphate deacetylase [Chloroflexia bacterium]